MSNPREEKISDAHSLILARSGEQKQEEAPTQVLEDSEDALTQEFSSFPDLFPSAAPSYSASSARVLNALTTEEENKERESKRRKRRRETVVGENPHSPTGSPTPARTNGDSKHVEARLSLTDRLPLTTTRQTTAVPTPGTRTLRQSSSIQPGASTTSHTSTVSRHR